MRGVSITAWDADLWRFSDDGFPLLASVNGDLQAAGAALGLTRVLVARGSRRFNIALSPFSTLAASDGLLLLDANGDAANAAGFSRTGAPVCGFADGAARAETGYNGAAVQMTVIGEGVSLQEFGGCAFALSAAESNLSATVRIVAEAGTAALTLDYPIDAFAATDDAGDAPSFQTPPSELIIPAFAGRNTEILTLTIAGGFDKFSWQVIAGPFSAQGNEATRTGTARITVAATAFFTVDMQMVTAHIVAADSAARVASLVVDAKSAPRAINGETYSTVLTLINNTVTAGFEVISAANVRNEVWHHQDEIYSLESDFGLFGVNSGNGRISLTVDLTMTGSWNLTLLAAGGGVTATQTVAVSTGEANNEAPTPSTTRLSAFHLTPSPTIRYSLCRCRMRARSATGR